MDLKGGVLTRKVLKALVVYLVLAWSRSSASADDIVYSTGFLPTPPELADTVPFLATPQISPKGSLQTEVDLSRYFPAPRSQGPQGSCVGWAVAYYKTFLENQLRQESPDELDRLVSPAFIFNQIGNRETCQGSSLYNAFKLLQTKGAVSWVRFPYDPAPNGCKTLPDNKVLQDAENWKLANWRRVDTKHTDRLKTLLAAGEPMVIAISIDQAFRKHLGNTVLDAVTESEGGHAVVLVGYSDSRQAFRILNSWGTKWGDKGYLWMSYRSFSERVKEGWIATQEEDGPPVTLDKVNDDEAILVMNQAALISVLDNDVLPDSASAKLSLLVAPVQGTVTLRGNAFYFQPNPGFVGEDSFYYMVKDGLGGRGVARVRMAIQKTPARADRPAPVTSSADPCERYRSRHKAAYKICQEQLGM